MRTRIRRLLVSLLAAAALLAALPVPAAAAGFTDVPADSWAASSIRRSVELGLFQGESATTFGMGHRMTRGAFAVVLCRFFGWELLTPEKGSFSDVQDPSLWYYSAVETALAHDALTEQTDTFRPGDPITREELAVMLVRALGYGTIAGLAQEVSAPFTDTTTNAGYIAMAYELGIVNGTTATTFSPDATATREQAAVILMRLYDKLHQPDPGQLGILSSQGDLAHLEELDAAAVSAGRLVSTGSVCQVNGTMEEETLADLTAAVRQAQLPLLLRVIGSGTALASSSSASAAAAALAQSVKDGGYDGLFLDLSNLQDKQRSALTQLVQRTAQQLGDALLYVAVDLPALDSGSAGPYALDALGAAADRLVVQISGYEHQTGTLTVAPQEPLEELYGVLAQMRDLAAAGRLCVCISARGTLWAGGKQDGTADADAITALLEAGAEPYYSGRYASAYLTWEEGNSSCTAWYLDSRALAEREQLLKLFGVDQILLSTLDAPTTALAPAAG